LFFHHASSTVFSGVIYILTQKCFQCSVKKGFPTLNVINVIVLKQSEKSASAEA